MTLRSLLVITCLLLGLSLHAEALTIHVETPGTLSSYIASNEKDLITSLTLTGDLNGTDIRYIREMAGKDVNGDATSGKLSVLDISGVNIVSGGDYYCSNYNSNYNSSDNAIGSLMFNNCARLTSISIPNSVTSIGDYAFFYCIRLTSVTIPNSVTSIGDGAFQFCSGLTSVTIGNSVTSIDYYAFQNCIGLTEILVSRENTSFCSVDGVLFSKDESTLISYPNSRSNSYTIPNSVTSIGDRAFYVCDRLTSVTIPNSVTSIGTYAFYGCIGLTSVTIPNSITSIGWGAFYGCDGLTSVTIPNSVTSIGYYAFYYCSGLTSITIPNSVTSIGYEAFCGCRGLTSVTIPNSVTSIGQSAFSYCSGLTSVTIGNGVTSIGQSAFSYCSGLTSVTIPNSVTSIGWGAFDGCSGLKEIHNNNTIPQNADSFVFNGVDKTTCILYVPKGSLSSYRTAEGWSDFTTIIEEELTSNPQIQTGNIKVYTEAEAILIEGAEPGETISVYTESGSLIQTTQVTDNIVRINVPRGHTYLIKTTGKTFKVAL